MKPQSYTTSITVDQSPVIVFNHINNVPAWWSKDFEGRSSRLNDEFVISHPGRHFSRQKLIEVIPGKRLVWLVTDSSLDWLETDKQEWTNTKMIFDITTDNGKTILHFTHEGLIPQKECYARCEQGWNMVLKDKLSGLIASNG